ncbi:SLATT domain-containing protein [Streptomyces anulatus]|uniref:SLATT domain-containing protein n=1 Tax=Streptomyces anulatus TaxID=1892 RepID=UPI002F913F63
MTQLSSALDDQMATLIEHRRTVAGLRRDITKVRRALFAGILALTCAVSLLVTLCIITMNTWGRTDMGGVNTLGVITIIVMTLGGLYVLDSHSNVTVKKEDGSVEYLSLPDLRLNLELAEEQRLLLAAYVSRPAHERRYSYRDGIPAEVRRLREEGRRYSRWHNGFQWLLILCSAAIPAVAALYDPPQPGKGLLIGLGASVSVITSAMGYYKFRERSFNLQQTADSIEQHLAALDLTIPPYSDADERQNLARFAEAVESLRDEQRKREQQLDQPHQGQQGSI